MTVPVIISFVPLGEAQAYPLSFADCPVWNESASPILGIPNLATKRHPLRPLVVKFITFGEAINIGFGAEGAADPDEFRDVDQAVGV